MKDIREEIRQILINKKDEEKITQILLSGLKFSDQELTEEEKQLLDSRVEEKEV